MAEDIARDAGYVLRHFGEEKGTGRAPGAFYAALIEAFGKADGENRSRLTLGFPVLGSMFAAAQDSPIGMDQLRIAHETGEWPVPFSAVVPEPGPDIEAPEPEEDADKS